MDQADLIWHNGELVAWEDAKVHVLTHGLHYGTGVFEGVRAYETADGTAIFRHRITSSASSARRSCTTCRCRTRAAELRQATHELLISNGLRECYIRPVAFRGYGVMGLFPLEAPVDVSIAAWPWGAYLGEDSKQVGIRAKVASWRRMSADSFIPESKASGQYLNSILAKIEATKAGYEEAILLDQRGFVGEGSGENLFLVKGGVIMTPALAGGILEGITRNSVIRIANDLGYEVIERDIARTELYVADEIFACGTAAEIAAVREVDDHVVGEGLRGPVTAELQRVFEDAIRGRDQRYAEWLDHVEVPAPTA